MKQLQVESILNDNSRFAVEVASEKVCISSPKTCGCKILLVLSAPGKGQYKLPKNKNKMVMHSGVPIYRSDLINSDAGVMHLIFFVENINAMLAPRFH